MRTRAGSRFSSPEMYMFHCCERRRVYCGHCEMVSSSSGNKDRLEQVAEVHGYVSCTDRVWRLSSWVTFVLNGGKQ